MGSASAFSRSIETTRFGLVGALGLRLVAAVPVLAPAATGLPVGKVGDENMKSMDMG